MDDSGTPSLHLNNGSTTREATQRPPLGFIEIESEGGGTCLIAVDAIRGVFAAKANGVPALNLCGLVIENIAQPITVAHNVREVGRRIHHAVCELPEWYDNAARGTFFEKAAAKLDALMEALSRPGMPFGPPIPYTPVAMPCDLCAPAPTTAARGSATAVPACRHCTQPMAPAHGGGFECIPCGDTAPAHAGT